MMSDDIERARAPPPAKRAPSAAGIAPIAIDMLDEHVAAMATKDVWALATMAAAGGPARRYLPTAGNRLVNTQAATAVRILRKLLLLIAAGIAQAEAFVLFYPRIFLAKGHSITDQLAALLASKQPGAEGATAVDPVHGWLQRLAAAIAEPAQAKLAGLLERGPEAFDKRNRTSPPTRLSELYPDVTEAEEEHKQVAELLRATVGDNERVPVTAKALHAWAACHRTSSGGSCGWTGTLLLAIDATDRRISSETPVLELLAELWSRAPREWLDPSAADFALRRCDGWLIHREGKTPRPIAAPQVPRRIRSAIDAKRARPLVAQFCEPRGQIGASGDVHQVCYSLLPQLVVHTGGTTVSADRSQSFQRFTRPALLLALQTAVQEAKVTDRKDEAAALVRLAADALFDHATLSRTHVVFDEGTVTVPSLPQGCTLSPTMEALTLATAMHAADVPRGAVIVGNHDDLQVSWYGNADAHLQLPDTAAVGGSYNADKAVAVGERAVEAVRDAGLAATVATATTVWGRPVGNVLRWLRETWIPKWNQRVHNVERIAQLNGDLAIACALKTGGPGSAARHWLRGTPPQLLNCMLLKNELASVDTDWVRLFVRLAGGEPTDDCIDRCRSIVFSKNGLQQQSAEALARVVPHAAVETSIGKLLDIAHERGFDPRPWGKLLCLRQLASAPAALILPEQRALIQAEAESNAIAATSHEEEADAPLNLYSMALKDPGDLAKASDVSHVARTPRVLMYALARALRVPVWTACSGNTSSRPPPNCVCGAVYLRSEVAPLVNWACPDTRSRYLDDHGEHMASCKSLPTSCGYKRRHDTMVAMCAAIARNAGCVATTHDVPLFDHNGQRPADWMEKAANSTQHSKEYICCDLTIVGSDLQQAVNKKQEKYAQGLAMNGHLSLNIVALHTTGAIHAEALDTLRRWNKQMIVTQAGLGKPVGLCFTNVAATFARAFASTMAYQAQTFYRHMKGTLRGRKGPHQRHQQPPPLKKAEQRTLQRLTQEAVNAMSD